MRNKCLLYLLCFLMLFSLSGCNNNNGVANNDSTPTASVKKFFDSLKSQNFSAAKEVYAENMDNLPNFKNKVENISPLLANELFDKIFDFDYTIDKVELAPGNPNASTVFVTINAYDLGTAFENTIGDYLKTDLQMSFDGATDDEIIKEAEDTIINDIKTAQKTFSDKVEVKLTKENDLWKVDKIGENTSLLNALSGNIIATIDKLKESLPPSS